MPFDSVRDIDFGQIWEKQIRPFLNPGDREEFWDRRAYSFESQGRTSSYVNDLLARMELEPSFSLLDIGCGTGVISIPLSRLVGRVTALDLSQVMLDMLQKKISQNGIQNISLLKKNWHEVILDKDVEKHDVVLSSRSISGAKLADSLVKMDLLAKRACYITWRANSYEESEMEICKLLNKEYRPYAEYVVIYNLLYQMGIRSDMEIFESHQEEVYPDIEAAAAGLNRGALPPDEGIRQRAYAYVREKLVFQNGLWHRNSKYSWALIHWKK
jgi:SAM-dependent methyltransferase